MKTIFKAILITLALIILITTMVTAQDQRFNFGITGTLAIPQGPFRDNVERLGPGINFMFGYQLPNTPFLLGVDAGFVSFGSDERTEQLSPNIPDLRVRIRNSYNMGHGQLLLRMQGMNPGFRPFMDALLGFNYLYTETTLNNRSSFGEEPVLRDTNFDDWTLSYGLGAGVQIKLSEFQTYDDVNEVSKPARLYLTLQTRYMLGDEAEYLNSLSTNNGNVVYDIRKSRTNLVYIQVGVTFTF
jgi:opacity protein-like surface antigen